MNVDEVIQELAPVFEIVTTGFDKAQEPNEFEF